MLIFRGFFGGGGGGGRKSGFKTCVPQVKQQSHTTRGFTPNSGFAPGILVFICGLRIIAEVCPCLVPAYNNAIWQQESENLFLKSCEFGMLRCLLN